MRPQVAINVLTIYNNKLFLNDNKELPSKILEHGEIFDKCAARVLNTFSFKFDVDLSSLESRFKFVCSFNNLRKEDNFHRIEIFMLIFINENEISDNTDFYSIEELANGNKEESIQSALQILIFKYKIYSIEDITKLNAP
jgi:hypothetical protein